MRYAQIRSMDVSNGKGVGVALFVQGCSFHCKNCFNSSTWDFHSGKEWNESVENKVLDLCNMDYISHLSILGGEPMHPANAEDVIHLAKRFKAEFPSKKLWVWTGYLFEDIPDKEILSYADYVIDGRFEEDKKDITLKFRGSSNQRIWKKTTCGWKVLE